ncbi:MAG: glycosyl hydrolase [Verrucomicrobia bacterium]|jgi:putative membrane-bound dehydrogenase-like protein|nr:glycosyl hydrolase [Verrucomicrobiota bacterium]
MRLLVAFCSLGLALLASAAPTEGPVRVLYLDADGEEQSAVGPLHPLMAELGRDAIWFDYATGATPDAATLERFDALAVKPKADGSPALNTSIKLPNGATVAVLVIKGDTTPAAFRSELEAALSPARKAAWQKFLAQREPEVREKNGNVANYEKRPEPLTFQKPYSVKGSMERTQVPADMKLVLFASEPDIMKPIAFAWDARGRLWVCETSDYPHGVKEDQQQGNDRIKICEDTDGDGKADKFTVFADRLNIPTSLVFVDGGVIVAQAPNFVFLKDTDGDDKADVRKVILTGWGIRDTHAQTSSLSYGYDNWLRGAVGYSGFAGEVGGEKKNFAMGSYRFTADGSQLEFLHQFSNNTWGYGANAAGDSFGGTANNAPIFFGGIPATAWAKGSRGMSAKKINLVDKAHTITPNFRQVDVMGGYTAAAGSTFIYSAQLPPRLQGKAMVCEPTMKLITLMDVQPSGAGYVAKDAFSLVASTDEWMSPVFAEVGPDGAIWFADWQNFIIQHNPTPSVNRGGYDAKTGVGGAHENDLRDHARGRIYRIVWDKAGNVAKAAQGDSSAELLAGLAGSTQYGRLRAQRLIVEGKKADLAPALRDLVVKSSADVAAIHALWSLQGLGQLDAATHQAALLSASPELRRNAIRALGADAAAQKLFFGAGVVADKAPATRLAALVKLADFPTSPEVQTLVRQLAADPAVKADEWLNEAARLLAKKHKTATYVEGPNLLPNPGFEDVAEDKKTPLGWKRRDYGARAGNKDANWGIVIDPKNVRSGKHSMRVISRADADTSFFADVTLKPDTEYRLSAWIKTHALRGKASLNDHIGRAETEKVTARESDWTEVEVVFNSGKRTKASINLLHVATGDSFFDDVRLSELTVAGDAPVTAGDAARGAEIFVRHPTAACATCHMVGGKGSAIGPALDGIATRATPAYIHESLTEPNKVLAKGYEKLGVSPMPPMGLILKPQELEDVKAFLQTLK